MVYCIFCLSVYTSNQQLVTFRYLLCRDQLNLSMSYAATAVFLELYVKPVVQTYMQILDVPWLWTFYAALQCAL